MNVADPLASVIPSVRGKVLAVLARTERPLTGRQVARHLAGVASQRAVQNALNDAVRAGLVFREDHPPLALYQLNRDHLATPALLMLADLRSALFARVRAHVQTWAVPPEQVVLFGSAARADGDESADIDLLVLRPDDVDVDDDGWRSQVHTLADAVMRWTGNRADIIELSASAYGALGPADPVRRGVAQDGIVLVDRLSSRAGS